MGCSYKKVERMLLFADKLVMKYEIWVILL